MLTCEPELCHFSVLPKVEVHFKRDLSPRIKNHPKGSTTADAEKMRDAFDRLLNHNNLAV